MTISLLKRGLPFAVSALTLFSASSALAQELEAEVIHFLTSESESAAIGEFAKAFEERGGTWVDSAVAGGPNAKSTAINRILGGTPPAAAMFNLGPEFLELAQNGLLRDLEDIAGPADWRGRMPAAMAEAGQLDDHFYVLSTALNGANFIWFNKEVLQEAGATEPTSWEEMFAALDKVAATGKIPLAFAGQKNWESQTFWAVALGVGGREVYERLLQDLDPEAARTPEFRAAAEAFVRLRQYVDPGSSGRNWNDAANMVITGQAGFMQMGTWARGEFNSAAQVPDVDYGCTILNVDEGYQLSGGLFLFPQLSDPQAIEAQTLLIETMSDPAAQARFASRNGSVPFWEGADRSTLDACVAKSADWATTDGLAVGQPGVLISPTLNGELNDAISSLWNTPDASIDAFVETFAATLAAGI